ncbi:ABC transporter related [Parvibaculum lavamentivorans DS-1]|uniref:ABC transporter related n=1 Tax=Parvibaculum lavamentivorans (strain DS-1 / DSM 13023 / NCIMB 13966) TaxID=402881 RepID=A7HQJ3_PARL1|nr:ABC transporter ATP-binding protein [Parvibaculum lavamentivorans]ABS62176.1 ABC transporter related [Parvibaculum lavamentivorans DS-1]
MNISISPRRIAAFLWDHWRRHPVRGSLLIGLMLVSVAFDVAFPIVSGRLVDAVAQAETPPAPSDIDLVLLALWLFVGQALGFQTSRRAAMLVWAGFASRVMREIVTEAFHRVQRYPTDWHSNSFAGATVRKITRGMWAYDTLADTIYIGFVPTGCVLVGITISIAIYWPLIGLYVLVGIVLYLAVTYGLVKRFVSPRNKLNVAADSAMGGAIADAVTCNPVVKSFGAESREDARLFLLTDDWSKKARRAWRSMDLTMLAQVLVLLLLQIGLLGLVILLWMRGEATPGDVAYAMTSYLLISSYLRDIGFHLQNLQRGANELEDVVRFADMPPEETAEEGARPLKVNGGSLRLERVGFRYPNGAEPIYRNLSLDIPAGARIALVGQSGSGKSTFVKLLQRLYSIDSGRILIDGQDIAGVSLESLRRAIALVPQEPVLFHRSIAENIAYAKPGATREEVEQAARLAHADDFIGELSEGYDTLVGERGVKLSGGERQRIAIARAFLADTPILVLDEATSSLDSVTEAHIQDAMERLMEGRTTLVIAHRLSTIRRMDRILVFRKGEVVEQGTHADLMARKDGVFRHLQAVQLAGARNVLGETA